MFAKLRTLASFDGDGRFTDAIEDEVKIGEKKIAEKAKLEAGVVTEDSNKFVGDGLEMKHFEEMTEREVHRAIDLVGGKDGDMSESSQSKDNDEIVTLMRGVHMINDYNHQEAQPKKTNSNPKPLPRIRRTMVEEQNSLPLTKERLSARAGQGTIQARGRAGHNPGTEQSAVETGQGTAGTGQGMPANGTGIPLPHTNLVVTHHQFHPIDWDKPPIFDESPEESKYILTFNDCFISLWQLSDVGLFSSTQTQISSDASRSKGRMDQEGRKLMFQLGVLILELITGQFSEKDGTNLVKWVQEPGFNTSMDRMVDPDIGNSCDFGELKTLLNVAKYCTSTRRGKATFSVQHILQYLQKKVEPSLQRF
ncbi:hypothetical protein GIB67_034388 [Kingdonia uniflora]|uniref:Uncharacterized protein n=1 Tax=Kingdonia uniflora TaxID=39325 RepID=A0A7J7NS36_9MAGN|nr:hypothetical protein GIB67_034388 [Kingdonia uniflora]